VYRVRCAQYTSCILPQYCVQCRLANPSCMVCNRLCRTLTSPYCLCALHMYANPMQNGPGGTADLDLQVQQLEGALADKDEQLAVALSRHGSTSWRSRSQRRRATAS